MNKYCVIPLCALIIGHWAILGRGAFKSQFIHLSLPNTHLIFLFRYADAMLTAYWDPNVGCITHITNNKILAASYMYTICLDFIVLILTAWKLLPGACRPSHFTKALFQNGLIYFVIAYVLLLLWHLHVDVERECSPTDDVLGSCLTSLLLFLLSSI